MTVADPRPFAVFLPFCLLFTTLVFFTGRLTRGAVPTPELRATQSGNKATALPEGAHTNGVTKIIHQAWDSGDLPERYQPWAEGFKARHPGWQYILWNSTTNRELIKDEYPWFLWFYDSFPTEIQRLDAARVFYMHKFGGVYVDVDFECLHSLEPLLNNMTASAVVGQMDPDLTWRHSIPNAFMASRPGHPLWMFAAYRMMKLIKHNPRERQPEVVTGPAMLNLVVRRWLEDYGSDDLTVLPPPVIYPINWRDRDAAGEECKIARGHPHTLLNTEACKARFPDSFTITYFTHSWTSLA